MRPAVSFRAQDLVSPMVYSFHKQHPGTTGWLRKEEASCSGFRGTDAIQLQVLDPVELMEAGWAHVKKDDTIKGSCTTCLVCLERRLAPPASANACMHP